MPAAGPSTPLEYRALTPPRSRGIGSHAAAVDGQGSVASRSVPFQPGMAVRRFDVRASLHDPWQRLWVRRQRHEANLPVVVIVDVSASMGYRGVVDRMAQARALVEGLAPSVLRRGDSLSVIACGEHVRRGLDGPPTQGRSTMAAVLGRLAVTVPTDHDARGLPEAVLRLPARRALVFLVSDFHFDEALLRSVLARLARHDLVPVVLADPREFAPPARRGLRRVVDLETGEHRLLFQRPSLTARLQAVGRERRRRLEAIFAGAGRRPMWFDGPFDARRFNAWFAR